MSDRFRIRTAYAERVEALAACCAAGEIELPGLALLQGLLAKPEFDVAFIGEFTAGKSTLINALLGEDLLPTGLAATTARITYVSHGSSPRLQLRQYTGQTEDRPFTADVLKHLAAANPETVAAVESIHLTYPAPVLQGGVRFVDTPGTNDTDLQRVGLTYRVLPQADAVVFVAIYPVTASALEAFERLVLDNGIHNLFLVLNKADGYGADLEEVVEHARQCFEERAGRPVRLFPVSALDYLDGRLHQDPDRTAGSGFQPFVDTLTEFLAGSDRFQNQARQYDHHLSRLKEQAAELIGVRLDGLAMSEEDFQSRRKALESQLAKHKAEGARLAEDLRVKFDHLILRLERSLDGLVLEILNDVSLKFSLQADDVQAILLLVESTVHQRFVEWGARHQPDIQQCLEAMAQQTRQRLGGAIHGLRVSMVEYAGRQPEPRPVLPMSPEGALDGGRKSVAVMSIASLGAYSLLAMAQVAIAPVALLIAPVGLYLLHERRQQERKILKERVMEEIRTHAGAFKQEVLGDLRAAYGGIAREIIATMVSFAHGIQGQLQAVERDRKSREEEVQARRAELRRLIERVNQV